MSRLGRLLGAEHRSTLAYPSESLIDALTHARASSGARVDLSSVLSHADAYACIRVLADAAASLPLLTYRRTPRGRERVEPGSVPVDALLRRPAAWMTQGVFVGTTLTHLLSFGNCFITKRRTRGRVDALTFVDPRRVAITIKAGAPVYTVAQGDDDVAGDFKPVDILHIKALSLDGVLGMSPLTQAREALGLGITLHEFAGSWFANGSRPGGMLSVQGTLTAEGAQRLKEAWEARYKGSGRTGGTAVLEQGTMFTPITTSMMDAQFLEQRRLSATEIARVFRVPPWMIGADSGSSMTYANVEQQNQAFVTHSLRPWLCCIEDHLKADTDFFPDDGSLYPEFLMDALLRADSQTRADVYSLALAGKPWMTRNEVRRLENLDAVEDDAADELDAADPAALAPPQDPNENQDPNPEPEPSEAARALPHTLGASRG